MPLFMPYQVVITKAGSPSVLAIQEMDKPKPAPDEVLIEVHYAGINFADTLMRLGKGIISTTSTISIYARIRIEWRNRSDWK